MVEGSLSSSSWKLRGDAAMGCIVCVTTSSAVEGEEAPLLTSQNSNTSSGRLRGDEGTFKKNKLGAKPVALASFRVRGALQSLLPKKSTGHSVPHLEEPHEDDGWHGDSKDITETRELHLERDHLGNTYAPLASHCAPFQCIR